MFQTAFRVSTYTIHIFFDVIISLLVVVYLVDDDAFKYPNRMTISDRQDRSRDSSGKIKLNIDRMVNCYECHAVISSGGDVWSSFRLW